jgi:hypothetical protein
VAQLAFTFRVGATRRQLTWRVVAVDEQGRGHGTCEHHHETDLDAVRCPWTPTPWPDRCDLLVRQVRDERVATPRRRAA